MKKITLKEESYKKLLNEIGYGNDDLSNLSSELKYSIDDALQVVRDHMIMCNRLQEKPNPNVVQIDEHLNAIVKLIESIGNDSMV
jgi:beta-lactamase class D